MTTILSKLRGSGAFCFRLIRNTSKIILRVLKSYSESGTIKLLPPFITVKLLSEDKIETDSNLLTAENLETPSRSDSQCSCLTCALPPKLSDKLRRPSKLVEGISAEKFYRLGELLGEGTFSKVYLAEALMMPGGLVAIKVIEKSSLIRKKVSLSSHRIKTVEYEDLRWLIDHEVQIMSTLDHPHITHLEEVYEDDEKVYFVLELAKGGEVFDRLIEKVTFSEVEAADLLVQLLCAVGFMHDHGIVHRDLKLENLLYYDDTKDSKILVADFGLSEFEKELRAGSPVCGTPGYLSPEVISQHRCTSAADVWSIGVIAYILLAGYPPFFANADEEDNDATLFKKILKADFKFHNNAWSTISPEAKDFIRSLLSIDPKERPTCAEALKHPWLNDRQNLEARSKGGGVGILQDCDEEKWSARQHVAFAVSLIILIYSYISLITYLLNMGRDDSNSRLIELLESFVTAVIFQLSAWFAFFSDPIFNILSLFFIDDLNFNFIHVFNS